MDLIPVQDKPLDLALRKRNDEQQNDGCDGETLTTSTRPVSSISPEKKVVADQEPEQPRLLQKGLLKDLLPFFKTEPESAEEEDPDLCLESTCDSTAADSKAWKRKRPRVPHMEEFLKTLPFKKRICLMMKYSQDLPFMTQDGCP